MNGETKSRISRSISVRNDKIKDLENDIKEVTLFFATTQIPEVMKPYIEQVPLILSNELIELKNKNVIEYEIFKILESNLKIILKICTEDECTQGVLSGSANYRLHLFSGNKYKGKMVDILIDDIISIETIEKDRVEIQEYLETNNVFYKCRLENQESEHEIKDISLTAVYVNDIKIGVRKSSDNLDDLFKKFIDAMNSLTEKSEGNFILSHTYEVVKGFVVTLITLNGIKISNSFLNVDLLHSFFRIFNIDFEIESYSFDTEIFRKSGDLILNLDLFEETEEDN